MPLPAGLDPVDAGRLGLWLLAKRKQKRAQAPVFPDPVYGDHLAAKVAHVLIPWRLSGYPGASRYFAKLCGVSSITTRRWLRGVYPIPRRHALTLAGFLQGHASMCEALAHELRETKPQRRHVSRETLPEKRYIEIEKSQ